MFSVRILLPVVAAALLLGAGSAAMSARQQPVFTTGARSVAVYATVTDDDGRLLTDLTQDDFEVYDEGRRQPITLFANEQQPITVVIMLDRSSSTKTSFDLVQEAAETFIRRLLPSDKARIGTFSSTIDIKPPYFTSDYEQLIGILRTETQPAGPTPLWNAINEAIQALRGQNGRRVVLVFTDGVDEPRNAFGRNFSLKDVQRRAQAEDVMVYAVGLESYVPYGGRRAPLPGRGSLGLEPRMIAQKPDEGLSKLAAETGGGYFELSKAEDLRGAFKRVADELRQQYALAFEPPKLDGKVHRLELKVKRPGAKVRARKSYVAAPERADPR